MKQFIELREKTRLAMRGMNLKQIKQKFKKEIDAYQKGKELDWKAEAALLGWAIGAGEIKTDDPDELDNWLMKNVEDKKDFDNLKESVETVDEAKPPRMKGLSIYGSEISGLKYKNGTYSAQAVVYGSNKLGYRVRNEFGDFETLDLKTFAKRFG